MADPRTSIIYERLKRIRRIIAVSSGKGGVGKSLVATTLALALAGKGCKVGLFDLDFTSPSTHLILGVKDVKPSEDKGLIPPKVEDIEYMSLIYYSGDQPMPLRGTDTSNVLIEMLAVTLWGDLDYLIIDTPPGIGDAMLDLLRLIPRIEFLIVTTSSQLAFETIKKQVNLLQKLNIRIVGIVENMKMTPTKTVQHQTESLRAKFLLEIPYDDKIEGSIGYPNKLRATELARKVLKIADTL